MSKLPYVVAIASSEGGAGKSTVSVNLAVALSQLNKRVLVVDTIGDSLAHLAGAAPKKQLPPASTNKEHFINLSKRLTLYNVVCYIDYFIKELFAYLTLNRQRYDYIIVDLPSRIYDPSQYVLSHANRAIIPFTLRADTLRLIELALEGVAEARRDGNIYLDVDLFATRLNRKSKTELASWHEVQEGAYGALTFPFCTFDTAYEHEAYDNRKAFVELFAGDENATVYRELAKKVFASTPPNPRRSTYRKKGDTYVLIGTKGKH